MSKTIFSIMFGLHDYVGHIYQYHLSIAKVCELNHWKHVGLIPKDSKIKNTPKTWKKALANGNWENKDLKQNISSCFKNFLFLKGFLKKRNDGDIIFLEHFSLFNVLSLILALLFRRPKCSFFILHRFCFPKNGIKTALYRILHMLIKQKANKDKLILLTDSDLLAKEQAALFKQKINVVPIPHTNTAVVISKKEKHGIIDLWWPGGSTRLDKGLEYINLLSKQLAKSNKIRLLIADSAKDKIEMSEQICFLSKTLSTNDYYKLMKSVNIVLLPYIPNEYRLRTSGIFVEAIAAGSKVVTFKNTWMAYELRKYGLEDELAIFPDEFYLERIIKINQLNLDDKIKIMTDDYGQFHSEDNYANVLKNLSF